MKVVRTNGKQLILDSYFDEEGNFSDKIPNHAYIHFSCENCGEEDKKQKRRFQSPPRFLCRVCAKKTTLKERYGTEHASQSEEVKKKIGEASRKNNNISLMKKTLKERHGVDNASKIPSVIDKRKNTNRGILLPKLKEKLKEYDIEPLFDIDEYIGQRIDDENVFYSFRCLKCEVTFKGTLNGHFPNCPECFSVGSRAENEVVDFIKEIWNGEILQNSRNIIPNQQELDIYIPDKKLAIEFDGLYWHSQKEKYYHFNKTKECNKKGITLLHIFEDEWRDKKEIVKKIIKYHFGLIDKIYARKTIFKEISSKTAKEFLEENHIQGFSSSKYHFGLFYTGELVAVLSMQKPRYNSNYDWEMARVAYKYRIVGGLSKLIKNFRKLYSGSIITYSDRRFFIGDSYKTIGFSFLHESDVNYFYTDTFNRFSRVKFQKHKLPDLLEDYNSYISEKENMLNNGYFIIYDCGNFVYGLQ